MTDWTSRELLQLSNLYYNRGLEKAQMRDMSGAVSELRQCLQLNKNHTQARNLLGLVYYETGEMADALAEWVISTNFQARKNPAIAYINRLQERQEFLEEMKLASRKFNQALRLLQEDSEDLAILQLNKVLDLNPNFVRAHQLMALVYMKKHQYAKSERAIKKAIAIDRTNMVSLRYYNELKRIAYARKKRNLEDLTEENEQEYAALSADDVIIPTYHGDVLGGWMTVINLLVGVAIGLACFYFLLLPTKLSDVSASYNQQIVEITRSNNSQSAIVSSLTTQVEELTEELAQLQESSQLQVSQAQTLLAQYQTLLQAAEQSEAGDYVASMELLEAMDVTAVTDETLLSRYQSLLAESSEGAIQQLLALGIASYSAREYETAVSYLELCLSYTEESAEVWYWLGVSYKEAGDSSNAIRCLTVVIEEFSGSSLASEAKTQRGY